MLPAAIHSQHAQCTHTYTDCLVIESRKMASQKKTTAKGVCACISLNRKLKIRNAKHHFVFVTGTSCFYLLFTGGLSGADVMQLVGGKKKEFWSNMEQALPLSAE